MKQIFQLATLAAAVAALVAACGGDDSGTDRGNLRASPMTVATLGAAQIDAATAASGLQPISGKARCDVQVVALDYDTIGINGEPANASGALLVPGGACAGQSAPLLAYARGTEVSKPRTLANPQDEETLELLAIFAAQGYAVVATDYLGYAKSTYGFHPYLHADSEASSVIDSIRAARRAAPSVGANLSGKVFVSGYSQGGHASAATQRAIERDNAGEINLAAGAHLAGPYNMSGSLLLPDAIAGYQFFVPFFVTAWQKIYGNVYSKPSDAFNDPYAGYIENLLPSPTLTYTTLITTGTLPDGTPNQARDALFRQSFLNDTRTNPNSGLQIDARKNDLLGWTPKAPLLLCGGAGDPTVPPAVHQAALVADFNRRGITNYSSVDVDAQVQALFGPGGKAPAPGSAQFASYYASYHGTYEPPLCLAQARTLFERLK